MTTGEKSVCFKADYRRVSAKDKLALQKAAKRFRTQPSAYVWKNLASEIEPTTRPPWLRVNVDEMSRLLGISKRTLSDWMRRRLVPFERTGLKRRRSIVLFEIAAVDNALKRWRVKSVDD